MHSQQDARLERERICRPRAFNERAGQLVNSATPSTRTIEYPDGLLSATYTPSSPQSVVSVDHVGATELSFIQRETRLSNVSRHDMLCVCSAARAFPSHWYRLINAVLQGWLLVQIYPRSYVTVSALLASH